MAHNPKEEVNQLLFGVESDQPWNRIRSKHNEQGRLVKGEPDDAWQAFVIYRNMPYVLIENAGPRRLAKVAVQVSKKITLIQRWSSEWNWPARALAFDSAMLPKQAEEEAWQRQDFQERAARQARMITNMGRQALKQNAAGIENARDQL